METPVQKIATRRIEWVIAKALEAGIVAADSAFCANEDAGEVELTPDEMTRIAFQVAGNVTEWQMENAINIIQKAMKIKRDGKAVIH